MKEDPDERAVRLGEYVTAHRATVRAAAAAFGCSKSTVHKDLTQRLRQIDPALAGMVRKVLDVNKAERHLRGGQATKEKYSRAPHRAEQKANEAPGGVHSVLG